MVRDVFIPGADGSVAEHGLSYDDLPGSLLGEARAPVAPSDRPMSINEVSRQFGMTPRALRFYEVRGLINPQRRGPTRLYRRSDRDRLALILTGRRLGFTLAEIGDLLAKPNCKGLNLTREQCIAQINLLERQKRSTEIAIAELREIYSSFYKQFLDSADSRPGRPRQGR